MKKKKRQRVLAPFNKWINITTWRKIPWVERKLLIDSIKLQKTLQKKYPNGLISDEEYHNMNAEIEYLKSIGEH